MHRARTPEQFHAISALCLSYWRKKKERDYAKWFEDVYLTERWHKWYTTSAIPGIYPPQNALGSHNGDIKKACITMKKAKTGVVLNDSVPGVLALVAQETPDKPFGHCCQGPLPSKMMSRAQLHIVKGSHYRFKETKNRTTHKSILFNASTYMAKKDKPPVPVTKARVGRYIDSKRGRLEEKATVLDITTSYQSLHKVEILQPNLEASALQVTLEPIISLQTIATIRASYRCDCKAFWCTGWVCSHVVATMHLEKQFKLSEAIAMLPTTKASGGERKVKGPLYSPHQKVKTFTKPFLMGMLEEDPLYVNGWQISDEFDIEVNGVKLPRQVIAGVINGFCTGDVYKWRVDFSDDDIVYYELEVLVDLIIESRIRGLDVTQRPTFTRDDESDDSTSSENNSGGIRVH